MTLCPSPSSSVLVFAGFTQNGGSSGGLVGTFDLLCLSGMIIAVLADDSFASSTGAGQSANHLFVEDTMFHLELRNVSVNTADTSALMFDMPSAAHSAQADTSQFKFSLAGPTCFGIPS